MVSTRVRPPFRFASEAKIETEAKFSFRLEAKKGMISLVSHRSETAKNWSENEREIKQNEAKKSKRNEKEPKKLLNQEKIWSENERDTSTI
jgi:hypothetical protein